MATVLESDVIAGVMLVEPVLHGDARGLFVETFRHEWIPHAREMIQMNRADRQAGCIVGLHYHRFQADYWYVPFGRARIVLHDLRFGSPTGGATLSIDRGLRTDGVHDHGGIYIPPGVAHGFWAETDLILHYMVDRYHTGEDEFGVAWDDPGLGIAWPGTDPILSERDRTNPSLPAVGEDPPPYPAER